MSINDLVELLLNCEGPSLEDEWIRLIQRYRESGGKMDVATNRNGWHLIHLAAANGLMRVVKWLVDNGIDVNTRDEYGNTPLILALDLDIDGSIQNRIKIDFSCSRTIIDLGGDKAVANSEGRDVRSIAESYGKSVYRDYKELIEGYGNNRGP